MEQWFIDRLNRIKDVQDLSNKFAGKPVPREYIKELAAKYKVAVYQASRWIDNVRVPAHLPLTVTPKVKAHVLGRDNNTCQYCGGVGTQVDHVYPKCGGGHNLPYNLVAACKRCNDTKSSKIWIPNNIELLKSLSKRNYNKIVKSASPIILKAA